MVEPVATQQPESPSLPPKATATLETLSKSIAAFAIILYGCGFLITSIYHARYGFTETNPLRPRIASAGAWFLLFMTLPIALINGFMNSKAYNEHKDKWFAGIHVLIPSYMTACVGLQALFGTGWIFDFYQEEYPDQTIGTWHPLLIFFGTVAFVFVIVIFLQWKRVPRYIPALVWIACFAFIIQRSVDALFYKGRFQGNAIGLWFLVGGILVYFEGKRRSWRPILGDWPVTTFFIFAGLLAFANFYYPHIKSSVGGGTPIPVTIQFTKDSIIKPNQSVAAFLIDESDSGLYIVGKADKKATFIPRNAIGVVHFSDDLSDSSLFKK